jgi:preprotein translocase subunit SecF
MNHDSITLMERLIESSPIIVLVCLSFIALMLRLYMRAEQRIEEKDRTMIELQRETLEALHQVRDAVRELSVALRSAR